jgi:hypothetical protein
LSTNTVNVATVAAATTSSESALKEVTSRLTKVRFSLHVSAASGSTPTLDVTIVAEINGQDQVLGTFTQVTTTGDAESIVVDACPGDVKAVYVIGGGTPSFTFTVDASID